MGIFKRSNTDEGDNEDDQETQDTPPVDQNMPDLPEDEDIKPPEVPFDPTETPTDFSATRQLSMETIITANNKRLLYGYQTDKGLVREHNEDSVLTYYATSDSADELPDFGVFIVADGMGGYENGEVASALTTRIVAEIVISKTYTAILDGKDMSDIPPIAETLEEALETANKEVFKALEKGGTTCTAAVILRNRAYIAHVGDSRAYLVKKGGLEQITTDHSMKQRLVELGQMRADEKSSAENKLYKALGFREELEIDTMSRSLKPKTGILLCSDGLWNHVEDDAILKTLESSPEPQAACERLVALANTNGGSDNITVAYIMLH